LQICGSECIACSNGTDYKSAPARGVSTQGLKSTLIIIKEIQRAFQENGKKLNLPKYLFYKGLKIMEYLNKS